MEMTLFDLPPVAKREVPPVNPENPDPPRIEAGRHERRKRRPRGSLQREFEAQLRLRHIPYVSVDEAKKALFANAMLRSFHFVVYCKEGDNWLVLCRDPRRDDIDDMRQWESVFGDGFKAVFCWRRRGREELVCQTIAGERVSLEQLR